VWISDLSLSVLLFSLAIVAAFGIIVNGFSTDKDFQSARDDAATIGAYLLSEGVPASWNATTVVRPGIVSYNRINATKASFAMNMSNSSYESFKILMQTKNDFIVLLENNTGSIISLENHCVIGHPTAAVTKTFNTSLECSQADFSSVDYDNLAKITRLSVYSSGIVKMHIYVWN
jgi:hypothetical protein